MFYIAYTAYMNEHKAANQTDELRKLKVEAHNRKDIFPSTPPQTPLPFPLPLSHSASFYHHLNYAKPFPHHPKAPTFPKKSPIIYNGRQNKRIEVLTSKG